MDATQKVNRLKDAEKPILIFHYDHRSGSGFRRTSHKAAEEPMKK